MLKGEKQWERDCQQRVEWQSQLFLKSNLGLCLLISIKRLLFHQSIWNLWKSLATVLLSRFNIECNYLADRQSVVSMLHNQSKIISSPNQFIMRINWIRYASKSLGHRNCKSKIQRLQLTARAQQNNFLLQKKQYHTLPPPGTKPHRGLLKYLGRCTLVSSMNSFWRNIRIVGFPPEVQSVPANGLQGGHGKQAC